MKELSFKEAAQRLNVSPATVKNWTRQGLLATGKKFNPLESEIKSLKRKLSQKKSSRLTSRANKSAAERKFIPSEYIENSSGIKSVKRLAETLAGIEEETPVVLLAFSIYLISRSELLDEIWNPREELPRINHNNLSLEIALWHKELRRPPVKKLYDFFNSLSVPIQRDTAGLVYQILQSEGRKSEQGSYYTPPALADEVLDIYGGAGQRFLDPCCGTGMFLLAAALKYRTPHHIYGWDTDITAVHLARINMMLCFKELDFTPHIFHKNSLLEISNEKFDLVATNPPWGHHFSLQEQKLLKSGFGNIKTGESFSYFLQAGISYLKPDGILSYLLPESLLKVNTHRDIRKFLLDNAHIQYIKFLGKPFYKVQTKVIRMDLSVDSMNRNTTVFRKNRIYGVDSDRFLHNPYYIFDFNSTQKDYSIMNSVYAEKHFTLKKNALWILGIVSGNNGKYITKELRKGHLPLISGTDLESFRIRKPEQYIYFNRQILQQCAPLGNYRKHPKIVYKFITGVPVFALDRIGYVTLNSANSFYPLLDYPAESIIALFNSALYRFLLKKRFNSIKVLRSHLEELPLPRFTVDEHKTFINIVKTIEDEKQTEKLPSLVKHIDDLIFQYFKISEHEQKYILESI